MSCIIHCTDDDTELATLQGLESWKTLLRAAEIRQHTTLLEIARGLGESEVPQIQYHRKCRSIFTMKKLLETITHRGIQNQGADVKAKDTGTRKSSRDAPSTSRVYERLCIYVSSVTAQANTCQEHTHENVSHSVWSGELMPRFVK